MSCIETSFIPEPGLVIMTCGVAGSGKTTFAQALEQKGFFRLSIDEEIWATFGRFGIDYPESDYSQCQEVAREAIEKKLIANIGLNKATVLDLSFWNKAERARVARLIAAHGGHHQIVYLKVAEEVLKDRLKERSKRFDANAAFTITDDIFNAYFTGFQAPAGEGEIVIAS